MYNYFTQKKRDEEALQKLKDLHNEEKWKSKRKNNLNKLYGNYDNRIRNFIFDMIGSPVKIENVPNKVLSPRADFLEEQSSKIIGRKGMLFNNIMTDKERLEKILKRNGNSQSQENLPKLKNRALVLPQMPNSTNYPTSSTQTTEKKFNQPKMRYKARTDLERIFDVVNQNSFGSMSKTVLNKNLKKLDPDIKRKENKKGLLEGGDYTETEAIDSNIDTATNKDRKKETYKTDDSQSNVKNNKIREVMKKELKNKHVDNSGAKLLMKELYYKTYFKSASVYCLFNSSNYNMSNFQSIPIPTLVKNNDNALRRRQNSLEVPVNDELAVQDFLGSLPRSKSQDIISLDQNPIKNGKIKSRQIFPDEYAEYLRNSDLLKTMDFQDRSDGFHFNDDEDYDPKKLYELKKLTLLNNPTDYYRDDKKQKKAVKFYLEKQALGKINEEEPPHQVPPPDQDGKKPKDSEDKIKIGIDFIDKERIDLVSKLVLKKCNVITMKNKNNNTFHKAKDGKTMITNGMSIEEFNKKYQL